VSISSSIESEATLISKKELPAHCPPKDSSKWNMHPKVFLQFDDEGIAHCPYCGTLYKLV